MPTYEIEQYELHTMKHRVEAATAAEAVVKLFAGEADAVDNGLEFIEVAEDFGLPAEEYYDVADALRERGVMRGKDEIIPSIRSIEEI